MKIKESHRSDLGASQEAESDEETGQPLENTPPTLSLIRSTEEMQSNMSTSLTLGYNDAQQVNSPIDSLENNIDSDNRITGASSGSGEDVKYNSMTDNIVMPADEAAKSHTAHELTTQKLLSNSVADAEQVETSTSAKDSGHASLPTHDYKEPVQNTEMDGNKQLHSNGSHIYSTNLLDNKDQSMDDTSSVYTAGPNIAPSKKDAYISSLAHDLLNKALKEKPDEESLDRICKALPRYLKTFAVKIGSSDSALICCEVMVFVSRYRKLVGTIFQLPSPRC